MMKKAQTVTSNTDLKSEIIYIVVTLLNKMTVK